MMRRDVRNHFSGRAETVVQAGTIENLHVGVQASPFGRGHVPVPLMAPAVPSRFVPRDDQGRLLMAALRRRERHVVLHGPGGFGKTTLASWACASAEVREWYPGGILWAEVGQRPGTDRVVRLLTGMAILLTGSSSDTYADVASAAQAVRSALAGRRVLVVVDDAWSATDVSPFLNLGDSVSVLITTRRGGLPGGTHIAVGEMTVAEATELLGVCEGDGRAVEPLLCRTGRWPLALALASGLLRNLVDRHCKSVSLAVDELARELADQGIASLDDLTVADAVSGITRTVELSLEDLRALKDSSEGRFVDLAAFPPGETIPYRLLRLLWGVSEVRARAVGERLISRSLVVDVEGVGLRLHDVMREALRAMRPEGVRSAGIRVLDALRPPGGWHGLAEEYWFFADSLSFHLIQVNLTEELGCTLRDLRFLSRRIAVSGPTAADADLVRYRELVDTDAGSQEMVDLLRREAHLLTGALSPRDVAVTLENRSLGNTAVCGWLRESGRTHGRRGLWALHPPMDHDDRALTRTRAVTAPGECRDVDWHPEGRLLAIAGAMPTLEIVDVDRGWASGAAVETVCTAVDRVLWSPDGSRLAFLGLGNRCPTAHDRESNPREGLRNFGYDLYVYDVGAGKEVNGIHVPAPAALLTLTAPALCWSPDSRTLAVARESEVCLWDSSDDAGLKPLTAGRGFDREGELSLAWHPRHGLVAHTRVKDSSKRSAGVLRRWADPVHSQDEPDIWLAASLSGRGRSLAWRPGGSTAALELDGTVVIVDPLARRVLWRAAHRAVATVHWSPDGRRLAVREAVPWPRRGHSTLTLWDVPADADMDRGSAPVPSRSISLSREHNSRDQVAWRPDGGSLTTTGDRRGVQIWDARRQDSAIASSHRAVAMAYVRWSPDGRSLAVAGERGDWVTQGLWSQEPAQAHDRFPFSGRDPAGRHMWPEEVGVPSELRPRGGPPVVVDFAADDQGHLVGVWRQPLRVFSAPGRPLTELAPPAGARMWWDACFTPSGDRVVAAAGDGSWNDTVFAVWPVTGEAVSAATAWSRQSEARPGRSGVVWRISASETHAVVLANPGYVGLFRLTDMTPVCWVRVNGYVYDASFDPSGHYLAVTGDGALHVFAVHDGLPRREA
ncbi:NB-ARC domain-containing protein [Streptomyces sp. NPDC001250]|uniref:NB-ARC domain-containing protein n=1 Tax=unclassified Streptomyces TaxID=2593676 RepID=UPI00332B5436